MSETLYGKWADTVNSVAVAVARDYPDVEVEDLSQDLWVSVLESGWEHPSKGGAEILTKIAKRKALEYRAQHLTLSPQYAYRVSDVRRILDRVFEHANWVRGGGAVNPDPDLAPSAGASFYDMDDILVEFSDIKRAWDRLPVEYRRLIFARHALMEEFERGSSEQRTYYRAVARMVDILNEYQPARAASGRTISNAHAKYLVSREN